MRGILRRVTEKVVLIFTFAIFVDQYASDVVVETATASANI